MGSWWVESPSLLAGEGNVVVSWVVVIVCSEWGASLKTPLRLRGEKSAPR